MRKILLLLSLSLCIRTVGQSVSKRVLFIGNSYTEVNNLPNIISAAAASAGDVLTFDSRTPGGYTLLQHSNDGLTLAKISEGNWDYVVLQGQSQEAIFNEGNFYQGAINLKNKIKQYNPCSVPQLYITWGRKNGDPLNCPNIPVVCTYEGMDNQIKATYLALSDYLDAEVSPVSVLWRYLRANYPNIELYQSDESHPSQEGSYAAACCFYATIFRKDPTQITYNHTLNPQMAAVIRNAAKVSVFDNLNLWDYKELPVADFSYTIGTVNNQVLFSNTMEHADTFRWDFGDGTFSTTEVNPTHVYANNGNYTVTLTTSSCDSEGEHTATRSATISFCGHTPSISPETLFLCYDDSEFLSTEPADSYQWYDNGVPIPGATSQTLEVFYLSNGAITVNNPSVVTTVNGCAELSRSTVVKKHQWSEFIGLPLFDVTVEGNIINGNQVCVGDTVTLNTFFAPSHFAQWYKDDVAIPSATSDVLQVTESGTYKVRIDHPICENMTFYSDWYLDPITLNFIECSLENEEYPIVSLNPETHILNIETNFPIREIVIQDLLGKRILSKTIDNTDTDVSSLSSGIYLVRIITNQDKSYVVKFAKN